MSLLLIALVAAVALNLAALIASRSGTSRKHEWAFWSGLTGLAGLPLFLAGTPVVALGALAGAEMEGLAGLALLALALVATATIASAILSIGLFARNS